MPDVSDKGSYGSLRDFHPASNLSYYRARYYDPVIGRLRAGKMFDEGRRFRRVGGTEGNKKKRQLAHPCATQPVGARAERKKGKIKACPTRQSSSGSRGGHPPIAATSSDKQ